jgi:hypothetical protein
VIFPDLAGLGKLYALEDELAAPEKFLREGLAGASGRPIHILMTGLDPDGDAVERAGRMAAEHARTIVFCYDAHAYAGGRRLLAACEAAAPECLAVFLKNPVRADRRIARTFGGPDRASGRGPHGLEEVE